MQIERVVIATTFTSFLQCSNPIFVGEKRSSPPCSGAVRKARTCLRKIRSNFSPYSFGIRSFSVSIPLLIRFFSISFAILFLRSAQFYEVSLLSSPSGVILRNTNSFKCTLSLPYIFSVFVSFLMVLPTFTTPRRVDCLRFPVQPSYCNLSKRKRFFQ